MHLVNEQSSISRNSILIIIQKLFYLKRKSYFQIPSIPSRSSPKSQVATAHRESPPPLPISKPPPLTHKKMSRITSSTSSSLTIDKFRLISVLGRGHFGKVCFQYTKCGFIIIVVIHA